MSEQELSSLEVSPGDLLILKAAEKLTQPEVEQLQMMLQPIAKKMGCNAVILPPGADLQVMPNLMEVVNRIDALTQAVSELAANTANVVDLLVDGVGDDGLSATYLNGDRH